MEYLDERFPHPPLHQMDPVSRANARMIIKRIDQDWYHLLDEVLNSGEKKSARAKKMLKESLIAAAPLFAANEFFKSYKTSSRSTNVGEVPLGLSSSRLSGGSLGSKYSISAVTPFSCKASLVQWLSAQVGEENKVMTERRVLTVTTNHNSKIVKD
jgi:hypothetical protein